MTNDGRDGDGSRGTRPEGRGRVLVVDDDPWMLRVIEGLLAFDLDVTTCDSGELALHVIEREDFDVVCTDQKMRRVTGVELLRAVTLRRPHAGRLLVTGTEDYAQRDERIDYYVLLKPFDPAQLLRIVGQMARVARMRRGFPCPVPGAQSAPPPASTPPPASRDAPRSERSSPGAGLRSSAPPPLSGTRTPDGRVHSPLSIQKLRKPS